MIYVFFKNFLRALKSQIRTYMYMCGYVYTYIYTHTHTFFLIHLGSILIYRRIIESSI